MATGWLHDNGSLYYLTNYGAVTNGWAKDGSWYYFYPSGAMATGWVNDNNTWYWVDYWAGMSNYQWSWINGAYYYFNWGGAMATGWNKDNTNTWYFLDSNGVWNPSPWINVPFIDQMAWGAPEGCEGASLLEALHGKGLLTGTNLPQFLKSMPYSSNGDPNNGFEGTPYAYRYDVETIYPKALTPWAQQYTNAENISGQSAAYLREELRAGRPVVMWTTQHFVAPQWKHYWWGWTPFNLHVVCVNGYSNGSYHVADPWLGNFWVDGGTFESIWNAIDLGVAIG